MAVQDARDTIERAIRARVFPGASLEIGASAGVLWREAAGTLSFEPGAPRVTDRTIFDLASLTKPMATATVVLQLAAAGALSLSDRVGGFFEEWRGDERAPATVRDLLEHASGLPARLVDPPPGGRREFEHDICTMPLECPPRARSIYSDVGFILLGFLAADRGGAGLDELFRRAVPDIALAFGASRASAAVAPTWPLDDDLRRGRELAGEVHDSYAAVLGGVAGHAGLFGTSDAVGSFARALLRAARGDASVAAPLSSSQVGMATTRSTVPGSSRGLGWDMMLPTSSCGTSMSPDAFGHVGFTGTSVWIDPTRDRYFVLLSNRACRGGTLEQMREVRRAFHDALAYV
jgi:CubicO group peptidase (beta-lactamase class C family)